MAKSSKEMSKGAAGGGIFFITYIGAAIYFVDKAEGILGVGLALLQALVWPAYLVNRVFTLLQIS